METGIVGRNLTKGEGGEPSRIPCIFFPRSYHGKTSQYPCCANVCVSGGERRCLHQLLEIMETAFKGRMKRKGAHRGGGVRKSHPRKLLVYFCIYGFHVVHLLFARRHPLLTTAIPNLSP